MDSFYGGKSGLSFVLKGRFDSISDMIQAFKRGDSYRDIWYNEFCIIDTPNKNNVDNGKIYQRGLDYTNDMGGAVYKGQIVGPMSGTPFMQMNTIQEVKNQSTKAIPEDWERVYPTGYDTDDEGHVIGYKTTLDAGEEKKPIATFPFSKAHDTSLVPGKSEDGTFVDEITWTWCNIRTPDGNKSSWYYVGFTIPYMVVEYDTHVVSQYNSTGNFQADTTTVERIDDRTHPFFTSWDFGIPKGIKGDAIRNLRVIIPTSGDTIYAPSAIQVDTETGLVSLGAAGYTGQAEDIAAGRKILVFDMYYYDGQINPDPVMIYVGDFNKIDEITLADDGTLTVDFSHDDNTVFSRKIKWITSTTLSPDTGVFIVNYNNGDPAFTTTLDWIKSITLDNDGTIHYHHTANNVDETHNNVIKWVTSVELNPTTGLFTMNFNYGSPLTRQLDWVDDIYIDEDTGEITLHHVNAAIGEDGEVILPAKLKLITSASVSSDGVVTMYTNTGNSIKLKQQGSEEDYHIKIIENVLLNTALADDKRIQVKYNTERTNTPIGDPINFVHDMVVRESDFHLLVLFNDPTHRATAGDLDDSGKDKNGITWVQGVTGSDGTPTGSGIYWRDYGTIKDQAGVLIGFNLTQADIGEDTDILNYLNEHYPNGLTEGSVKQKIVTFSPTIDDSKDFYAFDYNSYTWFYLGTISDTGSRDVMLRTQGQISDTDLRNLNSNGLLFKVIPTTGLKTDAIPEYWGRDYSAWQ